MNKKAKRLLHFRTVYPQVIHSPEVSGLFLFSIGLLYVILNGKQTTHDVPDFRY